MYRDETETKVKIHGLLTRVNKLIEVSNGRHIIKTTLVNDTHEVVEED